MLLSNQVAIVTGASSGIGRGIAEELIKNGCSVTIASRNVEILEDIKINYQSKGFHNVVVAKLDVTNKDEFQSVIDATLERFKKVDILINNAGIMFYTYMKNVTVDDWEKMVDVNCKGVMFGIGAVLPTMLSQKSGHIINISSDAGRKVFPGLSVYSATKFFVEALSQGLRLETADTGIKVTTIQPGDVKTNILQQSSDIKAIEECSQSDEEKFLQVEDIARAVMFALTQPKNCSVNEILIEPRECPV